MSFSVWKQWLGSLPWSLRWFVLLVLFRPFVDNFYFLKETSIFLSPLYIVGVMTPILIVASFFSGSLPKKNKSNLDQAFGFWGALVFFNVLALLTLQLSLDIMEVAIKMSTPVLIYFFARHLVQSKQDLKG